ncbi:MAG TPA: hypothetical protein VF893_00545 [Candidatus Bathyarchaeia archaeon]
MLRSTHKVIAERIAVKLGFSQGNTQIFVDGSTGPDSHCDFPHQTGKDKKILSKIDTARTLFLQNDEYSYGELANALHYIRDKWTRNQEDEKARVPVIDDEHFLQSVKQLKMPKKAAEEYVKVADTLLTVKNMGIESWFDNSWGIWHRDYSSCIFVFADVVEMMLPTLQPDLSVTGNRENLKKYVKTEVFKKATENGFFASIMTNFLYPRLAGYSAAIYSLASLSPPPDYSNSAIDLEVAFRLSLEIARYTLSPPERFKYQDNWTNRTKNERDERMQLACVVPQYHVLIPKPSEEIRQERLLRFESEARSFLEERSSMGEGIPALRRRSGTWNILLSGLVEMLKTKQG